MPDPSGPGPEVRAAGGVLWRQGPGGVEVALVHRPRYGDWSLPKGKLEPREAAVVGGVREVREETGFTGVPGRSLGSSRYRVLDHGRDVEKTVQWWSMRAQEGAFTPNDEVDEVRWMPVASALARVSAGYDCAPLEAFQQCPAETATVLLLRHGAAGSRSEDPQEDATRPLDDTGRAQAAAAAAVLAVYEPVRVLSAAALRCLQTVQPLADRLGVVVERADAVGEQAGAAALSTLVRELAAGSRASVVCGSRGAVTGAVRDLGVGGDVRARKGSLWALSFHGEVLVDAHHTPQLTG